MPQQTQIFVGENRDGHSDYEIPGSAEIRVLAVNANFEDNGAGADWCPAVVMFSDSGSVIARALLPDVKVTAGGSAEASFFPGVKPGGAAGGGTFQWCRVVCGPAQPSGSIALPQTGTPMPIDTFATSDPANYQQTGANTWTIPNIPQIALGYVVVDGGGLTTLNGDVYCIAQSSNGGVVGAYGQNTHKLLIEWFSYTLTRQLETGGTWQAYAAGADTHNFDLVITFAAVY